MVTLESHQDAIVGAKWNSLDTSKAATVSWDHKMILWDLENASIFCFVKIVLETRTFRPLSDSKLKQGIHIALVQQYQWISNNRIDGQDHSSLGLQKQW